MKNKIGSILLSIVVAFALWLYVITAVSPGSRETYTEIPVTMEGESLLAERGLMITSRSASSVTMVLSGNRIDLSKVNSRNIILKADLSRIGEPGTQVITYTHSFPGNVASNAFVVESKHPETISVTVERRVIKDVPVEVKWIGSAADGFMSDRENRVLDHPTVTISGPESSVNEITKAVIDVDLTGARESISESYHYTLCNAQDEPVDAEWITTNVEEIRLDVKIQRVKDLALAYTLIEGGGARELNAEITLNVDTIRVSGSEKALEMLGDKIVIGTISLPDMVSDTILIFPINLPNGIKNLTGVTEVEAEVKLTGLATKEFVVEQINIANVPDGLQVDLITEKLNVVVRGPSAQIAKLTADDIIVTVDFTGAEVGISTFRANVSFSPAFEGVGALRMDSVSASISGARG